MLCWSLPNEGVKRSTPMNSAMSDSVAVDAMWSSRFGHDMDKVLAAKSLTLKLTGAGARSAEGTNSGHKNAEGMPAVGVHVERPVRLRGFKK